MNSMTPRGAEGFHQELRRSDGGQSGAAKPAYLKPAYADTAAGPESEELQFRSSSKRLVHRWETKPVTQTQILERRLFDRRLFLTAMIAFPLIVLVGFGRTYYAGGLFSAPPLPSKLVHLHGLLMTAWVALFVTQVRFISTQRIRLHQRMGYAGIGLAALIIATGLPVALRAAKYGSASTPDGIPPLAFLAIPLVDLLMFALLFGGAIYYRRTPAAHKSLMLLTAISFLPPAIGRIPIAPLLALGPLWFFGFPALLALLCLGLEARRHGRLNRVFLAGTVALIVSDVGRLMFMSTGAWMQFAAWATSFV